MRVLVANDPRVYREAIAGALPELRPRLLLEVFRAEPGELEREAARVLPHLIFCSRRLGGTVARSAGLLAWMVLYPNGEERAEAGDASGRTVVFPQGVTLDDLLCVVDRTGQLLLRLPTPE